MNHLLTPWLALLLHFSKRLRLCVVGSEESVRTTCGICQRERRIIKIRGCGGLSPQRSRRSGSADGRNRSYFLSGPILSLPFILRSGEEEEENMERHRFDGRSTCMLRDMPESPPWSPGDTRSFAATRADSSLDFLDALSLLGEAQ